VNRIRVEADRVVGLRGSGERWQVPLSAIASVYVTHVLRKRRQNFFVQYGEINLYTKDGVFVRLVKQSEKDNEAIPNPESREVDEAVTPLTSRDDLTDLQTATLHIAKRLGGIPSLYDQRDS
jgi:hypothetical protein